MATYAIGDLQGCFEPLQRLLKALAFDRRRDRLWLVGDLVNRGPDSLAVLRFLRDLGDRVVPVLGNHDLHLLAIYYGGNPLRSSDTLSEVLDAPDAPELLRWLRHQPLLVEDPETGWIMTHAGIPHIWSLDEARAYAREVARDLQSTIDHESAVVSASNGPAGPGKTAPSSCAPELLRKLYGDVPDCWSNTLTGTERRRMIVNYFTRMRLLTPKGCLDFAHKGVPGASVPVGYFPWFSLQPAESCNDGPRRILFGHWAALEGVTGLSNVRALDTGCVWGRTLTGFCLESGETVTVPAKP